MSEVSNDESRLHATEAQMRRALGLQDTPSPKPQSGLSAPPPSHSHRGPRHFVRDGEVPVTVTHREETGTNQLDVARQTIRSLTAARERAGRLLEDAQATIRDLQTKLMHERMSKDEAISRVSSENQATEQAIQSVQADLAAERDARRQAEAAFADAVAGSRDAEQRLRDMGAAERIDNPPQARLRGRPRKSADGERAAAPLGLDATGVRESMAPEQAEVQQAMQPRRRGRPPKVREPEPESQVVEWWVPDWKHRLWSNGEGHTRRSGEPVFTSETVK